MDKAYTWNNFVKDLRETGKEIKKIDWKETWKQTKKNMSHRLKSGMEDLGSATHKSWIFIKTIFT